MLSWYLTSVNYSDTFTQGLFIIDKGSLSLQGGG